MNKIKDYKKFDFEEQLNKLYTLTGNWNHDAWMVKSINDDEGVFIQSEMKTVYYDYYQHQNTQSYSLILIIWNGDNYDGEYEFITLENYVGDDKYLLLNKDEITKLAEKVIRDYKKENQVKKFKI